MVRASTTRVLDRLTDLPALVMDAKGDVLAWNAMATALLGDFSAWVPPTRNIVWQRFLGSCPTPPVPAGTRRRRRRRQAGRSQRTTSSISPLSTSYTKPAMTTSRSR